MRVRAILMTAVAMGLLATSPAYAKKKKNQPPVPVRPQPIIALSSPTAANVNYFYERRQEAPIWFTQAGGTAATAELLSLLRRASVDGMPTGPQVAAQVEAYVLKAQSGDALARKTAERALSNAWVDYVQALQRPSSNVVWGDPALVQKPDHPDRILALLAAAPSIPAHLKEVSDINPYYAALRDMALTDIGAGRSVSDKIQLNMERARIIPGEGKFILVNSAEQRLHLIEGRTSVASMKVVVGDNVKLGLPTPIIASTMHYAIANPYWHVPPHLIRKFAPNIAKDPVGYLKARNYEIISDFGKSPTIVSPTSVDWKAVAAGTSTVILRQKPGGTNSMGKMKFPFPNSQGIFLHDTPMRKYFTESNRALSNGCVRVEDFARLANWAFGRNVAAEGVAPEQAIALPRGIPVYVTYLTMVPGPTGMTSFEDRYGWDRPGALAGGMPVTAASHASVAAAPSAN